MNPSPQQRWQEFRDQHLPQLKRHQRWLIVISVVILILGFIILILPFLLPLTGPEAIEAQRLAEPTGTFIEIDGVTLYYDHRPATGDAVIFIHGLGGSTLSWQDVLPTLAAAGYDTYAVDLPGAGLSEKGLTLDYSQPYTATLLSHWMDSLGLEHAHVVAHAFSANLALHWYQKESERIDSLTLVAPSIVTMPTTQAPPIVFDLPFLERWTRVLLRWILPEAVRDQLRSATKRDEVVTDQLVADYSRVMHTAGWEFTPIGLLRDTHLNTLTLSLHEVTIPVLLLWGADDGWVPPSSAPTFEAIPDSKLVMLKGVGHLPMHETPADFNAVLINFLDNHNHKE
ncbi:MAG: alpha/beta hydrolase [Anaerolineales bacterium]|nr:alpha/beta hydrolase [Anaerolineales bacterium]